MKWCLPGVITGPAIVRRPLWSWQGYESRSRTQPTPIFHPTSFSFANFENVKLKVKKQRPQYDKKCFIAWFRCKSLNVKCDGSGRNFCFVNKRRRFGFKWFIYIAVFHWTVRSSAPNFSLEGTSVVTCRRSETTRRRSLTTGTQRP